MITPPQIQTFVRAEPFLPFRIHMASGKTFDIRHPEMIKVAKTFLIVFQYAAGESEFAERSEMVSLMLIEHISYLEQVNAPV